MSLILPQGLGPCLSLSNLLGIPLDTHQTPSILPVIDRAHIPPLESAGHHHIVLGGHGAQLTPWHRPLSFLTPPKVAVSGLEVSTPGPWRTAQMRTSISPFYAMRSSNIGTHGNLAAVLPSLVSLTARMLVVPLVAPPP